MDQIQSTPPLNKQTGFAHQAAKLCLISPAIVFVLLISTKSIPSRVAIDWCGLGLILIGLISGVVALCGIKKHGTKKLLSSALAGMTANGLLLFIFVTNFLAARDKAINQNISLTGSPDGKTLVAATSRLFQKDGVTFRYDGRYQLNESPQKHQISLQHPYSNVVITDHQAKLSEESMANFVTAIKQSFENQKYGNIQQGTVEPLNLTNFSGSKISLEYTRPGNLRVIADVCFVSSDRNSYSFLHFYSKSQSSIATNLFDPVLNSFAEIETTNQSNVLPSDK